MLSQPVEDRPERRLNNRLRQPAGGRSENGGVELVMSLMTRRDSGIVVAALSNITHANTSALGLKIGDAFAKQAR